jgi:AcrR family transcriptional regulator
VKTEELILDAAERLFAKHGVDGVSLRQIGAAAGSSNNFAVQYHFGDKARLLRAIFERRLPPLEVERARLLAKAKREGRLRDPRALLEVILFPIAEARDSAGRRSYAAFLLGLRHFHGSVEARLDAADLAPLTHHVSDLLSAASPPMPVPVYDRRFRHAWDIFLTELVDADNELDSDIRWVPEPVRLNAALDLAVAVLLAPVSEDLRAAYRDAE